MPAEGAAFMSIDVVGYSRLMQDDDEAILETQRLIPEAMGGWPISRRPARPFHGRLAQG